MALKIGLTYANYVGAFRRFLPELEIIENASQARLKKYDIVLFPGGEDITPALYGANSTFTHTTNPDRDNLELGIYKTIQEVHYRTGAFKPLIVGVCRGHQFLNAARGGNLCQDISIVMDQGHPRTHELEIISKSIFSDIFDRDPVVNSLHHQGVTRVGRGMQTTTKVGSIIESTEGPGIVTVQWHPELMDNGHLFFDAIRKLASGKMEVAQKEERPRMRLKHLIDERKNFIPEALRN